MERPSRLSAKKLGELMECFDEFSVDGVHLDKDDLKVAVTALLGVRPTKYEVKEMLAWSTQGEARLPGMTRDAFIECMSRRLALMGAAEEARQIFKAFDVGCRGFITREDLQKVVGEFFEDSEMPSEKVAEMFAEADWDRTGRIGYQQFESMITGRVPVEVQRTREGRTPS